MFTRVSHTVTRSLTSQRHVGCRDAGEIFALLKWAVDTTISQPQANQLECRQIRPHYGCGSCTKLIDKHFRTLLNTKVSSTKTFEINKLFIEMGMRRTHVAPCSGNGEIVKGTQG